MHYGLRRRIRTEHVAVGGPEPYETTVRQLDGEEYDLWWERAVEVFCPYAEYKEKAGDRKIPVFLTAPKP